MDEKEIQIHVKTFFQSYYTKPEVEEVEEDEEEPVEVPIVEPNFATVVAFVDETTATPSDVMLSLLDCVLEESQEHRDSFLPKVMAGVVQSGWKARDLEKGIGKFVQNLSD